jgi:membrane protease YdiL (CAAX protease family)
MAIFLWRAGIELSPRLNPRVWAELNSDQRPFTRRADVPTLLSLGDYISFFCSHLLEELFERSILLQHKLQHRTNVAFFFVRLQRQVVLGTIL